MGDLATMVNTKLKRMRYRPRLLDGFIAETGLILNHRNFHPSISEAA
ncbi:hypothetical protein [Nonomuraea basaltis]|nr:hypothetical protein [Nonomuraea basaltis]